MIREKREYLSRNGHYGQSKFVKLAVLHPKRHAKFKITHNIQVRRENRHQLQMALVMIGCRLKLPL